MASQSELAEKLQEKVLKRFGDLLDKDELSPTDAATLTRLLMNNGWTFDPAKIPTDLKDKLTKQVSFGDPEEDLKLEAQP